MTDLYCMAVLRCPSCGFEFDSEVEQMGGELKKGDKVLDQCPHCFDIGDMIFLKRWGDA